MIMRSGKTDRDHKSGAWGNRFENRAKRVDWQNTNGKAFPKETCNGKRNKIKR